MFGCVLFAIAAGLSRPWLENTFGVAGARVRMLGGCCVALLLAQFLAFSHSFWRERSLALLLRGSGLVLVVLVGLQIYLGARIIWTSRSVYMTTGHVVLGALTLAANFVVDLLSRREHQSL